MKPQNALPGYLQPEADPRKLLPCPLEAHVKEYFGLQGMAEVWLNTVEFTFDEVVSCLAFWESKNNR